MDIKLLQETGCLACLPTNSVNALKDGVADLVKHAVTMQPMMGQEQRCHNWVNVEC